MKPNIRAIPWNDTARGSTRHLVQFRSAPAWRPSQRGLRRRSRSGRGRATPSNVDRTAFREALLSVMEQKVHWAWPGFASGLVHASASRSLSRNMRRMCAISRVGRPRLRRGRSQRRAGADRERLYEETAGVRGSAASRAVREYPWAPRHGSESVSSPSRSYLRRLVSRGLDAATLQKGWEGRRGGHQTLRRRNAEERRGPGGGCPPRHRSRSTLVRHYGSPGTTGADRAHRSVEGDHRADWRVVPSTSSGRPHSRSWSRPCWRRSRLG